MIARAVSALTFIALVAAASACARDATPAPIEKQLDFGAHRVQVTVPAGWDALDQGTTKRFRKGELQVVLQNLGSKTTHDLDELIDWGLAKVGYDDKRGEEKSRHVTTVDGRETVDIEIWSRLDHSNLWKITLIKDGDDLLALTIDGMAMDDSLAAFDAIRSSLRFQK